MNVCKYVRVYVRTYLCMYVCVYDYVCSYVCVYVWMYVAMCVGMYFFYMVYCLPHYSSNTTSLLLLIWFHSAFNSSKDIELINFVNSL